MAWHGVAWLGIMLERDVRLGWWKSSSHRMVSAFAALLVLLLISFLLKKSRIIERRS